MHSCLAKPQQPYTSELLAAERDGEPVPLLRVKHLQVGFPIRRGLLKRMVDEKPALHDLSFTLRRGEVWFDNQPLRQRIQVVFQDLKSSLNPRMTVQQVIAEGLAVHRPTLSTAEQEAKVIAVMQEVVLDDGKRGAQRDGGYHRPSTVNTYQRHQCTHQCANAETQRTGPAMRPCLPCAGTHQGSRPWR